MNQSIKLTLAIIVLAISGCSPSVDTEATTPWVGSLKVDNNEYEAITLKHDEKEFPYRSPVVIFNKNETASWKAGLLKNLELGQIDFGSSQQVLTGRQIVYAAGNGPTMSILTWAPDEAKIEELGGLEEYLTFLMSKN
ncbi:hypothetical protein [Pelagicoccus mobilis]|uniref:Lipoprotein n=1 Tax=Pelagicoccus mobilis TaxID=415221 RepID=A0A934VN18_9BACT|nr:hypothetical protein [Pelagicoccus mobilis]MBK1875767.1 hypothetical protein [Pelagicoccus mobilis]